MGTHVRSFKASDERVELPRLISEVISIGSLGVAHNIHQPGWRWSVDVRPSVGTAWCEVRHVGYAICGRLALEFADGRTNEIVAGDVFDIPGSHDGRVVGHEPFESIEWFGARTWLADVATLRERVLATIVMTDIVASTSTAIALGERAWGDKVAAYEHAMGDVVENYGGRVVKFTGDGTLAVFDGTGRALRAAIAMRAAADDLGLLTRSAVHTGEIEASGDDIHGLAVHETARMLEVAPPSDVVVSSTTQLLGQGQGIGFRSLGARELRGLQGARELHVLDG